MAVTVWRRMARKLPWAFRAGSVESALFLAMVTGPPVTIAVAPVTIAARLMTAPTILVATVVGFVVFFASSCCCRWRDGIRRADSRPGEIQCRLSAESAQYARVITEEFSYIRPKGFDSFELSSRQPERWGRMALRDIRAFGSLFEVEVSEVSPSLFVILAFI